MANRLIRYFDLNSGQRGVQPPPNPVWPQYLVVAAGVLVEPYLRNYIQKGNWDVDPAGLLGRTIFALLIAVVILPAIYRGAFDPNKPISIQLMALFPLGIGWRSLFDTAVKAGQQAGVL